MPIYTYRCQACDKVNEAFRSIAERDNAPRCEHCKSVTKKIISKQSVHSDFAPYYDQNLETYIESKQHRKKVMKEKDVYEAYGKGWT